MIKYSFITDLHCWQFSRFGGPSENGLNRRAHEQLATIKRALDISRDCHSFTLGDVFDKVKPEPQLEKALRDIYWKAPTESNTLLVGNHDQNSTEAGDHALGPLAFENIEVVEKPYVWRTSIASKLHEVWCVPFRPGKASDWLPDVLEHLGVGEDGVTRRSPASGGSVLSRTLLLHLGIRDNKTPIFLKDSPDAIDLSILRKLCSKYSIQAVFAGNWHDHNVWDEGDLLVCQVGSLLPHSFSDGPGFRGVVTYEPETSKMEKFEIPGPRFIQIEHAIELETLPNGCSIYLRWETSAGELATVRQTIVELVDSGVLVAGEALIKEDKSLAKHTVAAVAVSFDEAIASWISERKFKTEVDRKSVLARVQGFMK